MALFDFVSSGVAMQAATRYFSAGRSASPTIEDVANAVAALIHRDDSDLGPFVAAWHPLLTDVDNAAEVPTSAASRVASLLQEQFRLASAGATDTVNTDWLTLSRDLVAAVNAPKVSGQVLSALAGELPRLAKVVLETAVDPARVDYLCDLLTLAGPRGPATIGTLNYDTTLEMCAARAGLDSDDGLARWLEPTTSVKATAARIFKVHGSIAWERDAAGHYRPQIRPSMTERQRSSSEVATS